VKTICNSETLVDAVCDRRMCYRRVGHQPSRIRQSQFTGGDASEWLDEPGVPRRTVFAAAVLSMGVGLIRPQGGWIMPRVIAEFGMKGFFGRR
jgi:hypothetical protein